MKPTRPIRTDMPSPEPLPVPKFVPVPPANMTLREAETVARNIVELKPEQVEMPLHMQKCSNCHYLAKSNKCRRYPPVPLVAGTYASYSQQPHVDPAISWCGEWKHLQAGVKIP